MKLTIHYGTEKSFLIVGDRKVTIANNIRSNNILKIIDQSLKKCNETISSIKEIEIYPGPGSFTSIRVTVSIANALSKTLNIPIRYYNGKTVSQAVPKYGKPASITLEPTKDLSIKK